MYSLVECEARLALLAAGLDPTLGVLHADQRNRDSFALDAMEPIRPAVDAFVLDLLEERVLSSRDFVELPNGICRVRAPLTHDLALTLPRWRQLMAPIVVNLAQAFRDELRRLVAPLHSRPRTTSRTIAKPAPAASSLVATPRKQRQPRPYASKAWNAPRLEPLLLTPISCATCGGPVLKRRRRHCHACIPGMKVAQAQKAVVAARKVLAVRAAAGNDPRSSREAGRKRGVANAEHHFRNHQWARENQADGRDATWFRREIAPKLSSYSLSAIARATGLSAAACSRIRSGAQIPHPRHWESFVAFLGSTDSKDRSP